jgi:Leucine-rich repeat (LRR) protein
LDVILADIFIPRAVALWLDNNNKITGTIPTEIGLLTELASLSITNATLTGTIPTEIGNLVKMRRMWLYDNQLTGSIPAELNSLTELEVLELHHNDLSGAMPQGICANINKADYELKALTADCVSEMTCVSTCCTECF